MTLPVGAFELDLEVAPEFIEGATHDDQILPLAGLVADMFGNEEFFVKTESSENPMGTDLGPHQSSDDAVDPVEGGEVKKLARDDRAETESLPGSGYDQSHLGDVVAPTVALELECAIGNDLVFRLNNDPFNPVAVEFGAPTFHEITAGHVGPKVFAVLFGQSTEKGIGTLHVVRPHSAHQDCLAVFERHSPFDCGCRTRRHGGRVHRDFSLALSTAERHNNAFVSASV